jgi:hypothetical protein
LRNKDQQTVVSELAKKHHGQASARIDPVPIPSSTIRSRLANRPRRKASTGAFRAWSARDVREIVAAAEEGVDQRLARVVRKGRP